MAHVARLVRPRGGPGQGGRGDGVAWIRHALQEMRRIEHGYLILHPESMACPLCEDVQANPGFCPRCRHTIMELYRTRDD